MRKGRGSLGATLIGKVPFPLEHGHKAKERSTSGQTDKSAEKKW